MVIPTKARHLLIGSSLILGLAAGGIAAMIRYVSKEVQRRGYPTWDECQCDFKNHNTIFQVWHSHHERRGATIILHERGIYLSHLPRWQRHLLHQAAQFLATLNPGHGYVERIALHPQNARYYQELWQQNEDINEVEEIPELHSDDVYVIWRSEILHFPRHLFDTCIRRLYPIHINTERLSLMGPQPILWEPQSNFPLPLEGSLLSVPPNTRIDFIGWSTAQISYCTARIHQPHDQSVPETTTIQQAQTE